MRARPLTRAQERSVMAAKMYRALSRGYCIEVTRTRPLAPVRGCLASIERTREPLIPVEDGGSNLMLVFDGGEEVPLELVAEVKRVAA
jgi:hypothetical protein